MGHIREVNGLRGIAIISVIFEHLRLGHEPPWDHTIPPSSFSELGLGFFAKGLYWNGWLSVNLFFVLSGFVLFLPYANGSKTLHTSSDWGSYYKRRAGRLLPLFYIAICLCTLLIKPMTSVGDTFKDLGLSLSGLFHFTPDHFWPPSNPVLWSLGVEIWFSVLFPVVAVSFFRLGMKKTLLLSFAFALICRVAVVLIFPNGLQGDMHLNAFKDTVFGRLDDFAIGMAVAALYVQKRLRSVGWMFAWMIIGSVLTEIGGALWSLQRCNLLPSWTCAFYNIPINLGFAALLMAVVSGNLPKLLGMALRNPVLQLAGVMCYSIYVWHFVILQQYAQRSQKWDVLLTYFFVTFLTALLSYRYIEFGDVKDWKKLFPMFFPAPARATPGKDRDFSAGEAPAAPESLVKID